ncbi:Ribosomal protein [Trema orientale]|uniref:Ribosomal protein n=1 Tax=Trema orientale TaxID=63057 RepID=A0A2P5E9J3_TREOI|nr:Ribosomal protein [Trema orientale]
MTKFRKLGRSTGHRMSMLRTMVSQLVKHERIETTVAKAKEIRRLADNMVQLGKDGAIELWLNFVRSHCLQLLTLGPFLVELLVIEKFVVSCAIAREVGVVRRNQVCVIESIKADSLFKDHVGSLCAARRAAAFVRGDDVIHKLFTELAYRYKDRAGGYTRLLRTRIRVGDAAPMAYIEFIDRENELRQSKPPTPQPPQRAPLDPWTRSKLCRQYAPPKEEKSSENEN